MKKLTRALLFNLILIMLLFFTGNILREKWEYKSGQYKFRYQKMKDSFDSEIKTVFLGSSGVFTGVNHTKIFEESGIPALSLAHNLQSPVSGYFIFEDFLKYSKGVEVVFVDMLGLTREVNPNIEHQEANFFNVLISIDDKKRYLDTLKEEFDKDYRKGYYTPIFKYHDRWNRLKKEDFFEIKKNNTLTSFQVEKVKPVKFESIYMKEDKEYQKSEVGEKYLKKIIDLAKSNNINVVLYLLPKMNYLINEIEEYHRFANEQNLPLIDFTEENLFNEIGIDLKTDFYDNFHLNYNGGKKVSKYLADYMLENFPTLNKNIPDSTKEIFQNEINIIKKKYEK